MKDKFYRAYDELYDIYPEEFLAFRIGFENTIFSKTIISDLREFSYKQEEFVRMMRDTIQIFEFDNRFPLRPDAKLFLITNFNQMIIKPLVYLRSNDRMDISDSELSNNIKSDLLTILNHSLEIRKEDKVSGHEIMKSIDKLWPNLASTKYELWG